MLQQRIDTLETTNSDFQLKLTSVGEELEIARGDIKRYSDDAAQKQELYQRELIEHSKSVQMQLEVKEKVGFHWKSKLANCQFGAGRGEGGTKSVI